MILNILYISAMNFSYGDFNGLWTSIVYLFVIERLREF
jgi:hypothetical protein